eukprot:1009194_1
MSTPGKRKQNSQGHHGLKGGHFGSITGQLSLQSEKLTLYKERKQRGLLRNDEKGGRRKKQIISNDTPTDVMTLSKVKQLSTKCLSSLSYRDQLRLIDVYHKKCSETGTTQCYSLVGQTIFGQRFMDDYPKKPKHAKGSNPRLNARNRMKTIIADERLLRYAVACGMEGSKWTAGGKPHNNLEETIANHLSTLSDANIKVTTSIICQVALQISANAGISCEMPNLKDGFMSRIAAEDVKHMQDLVDSSANSESKYIFSPTNAWIHKFNSRWDFMWSQDYERSVNLIKLLSNMESTLLYTYVMRRLYSIEPGTGRILNCDQAMWYRYYNTTKYWKPRNKKTKRKFNAKKK